LKVRTSISHTIDSVVPDWSSRRKGAAKDIKGARFVNKGRLRVVLLYHCEGTRIHEEGKAFLSCVGSHVSPRTCTATHWRHRLNQFAKPLGQVGLPRDVSNAMVHARMETL